jgi:hypothetical protein
MTIDRRVTGIGQIAPGAEALKRDLPDTEIHLLDAGHFALDEKNDDIAESCSRVLGQTFRLTDRNLVPCAALQRLARL